MQDEIMKIKEHKLNLSSRSNLSRIRSNTKSNLKSGNKSLKSEEKLERKNIVSRQSSKDSNSKLFASLDSKIKDREDQDLKYQTTYEIMVKTPSILNHDYETDRLTLCLRKFKKSGKALLEHVVTNVFLIILTVWALFADDLKMLTTTKEADTGFSVSITLILILFLLEVLISCFCINNYFNRFFFWLDSISILSMLLDIHWFYDTVIESISAESGTGGTNAQSAKVVSKAIRVLRVVRLIRIVRIVKIYKLSENFSNLKEKYDNVFDKMNFPKSEDVPNDKLKVGKELADSTMRRVIILVLSMILGIIVFDPNFYYNEVTSIEFGIKMFNDYPSINDVGLQTTIEQYVYAHQNSTNSILYLTVIDITYGNPNVTDTLRDDEKVEVYDDCSNFGPAYNLAIRSDILYISQVDSSTTRCFGVFDNRIEAKLTAILNISKTILVCLILFLGAFCFSKDTKSMVLEPLDSMVKKIQRISKNPSKAKQENEIEEYFKLLREIEESNKTGCCRPVVGEKKNIETIILDKTIVKIGSLLSMAYGPAGSTIIEKNLCLNNGEINPMSPGENIIGIWMHFNITNHTEVVEVLQHNYSILVNEVLQIISDLCLEKGVHNVKNVGDGFLVVWKMSEKFFAVDDNGNLVLENCSEVNQIIDSVLIFVVQVIVNVQVTKAISKYRNSVKEHLPNVNLNLSVGLNVGWGIEGTMGSNFKIDISYFSPHINYARTLENLNKTYNINILMSEKFVGLLTEFARAYVRPVDSILINKHTERIYTLDMDLSALETNREKNVSDNIIDKLLKYENREIKKRLYQETIKKGDCWNNFVAYDLDFEAVRIGYSEQFNGSFSSALELYVNGEWEEALYCLEELTLKYTFFDPVNEFLKNYIKENNCKAPSTWQGGRKVLVKK